MLNPEKIISELLVGGFRLTPLRRAIPNYLSSTDEHLANSLKKVPKFIQERMVVHLHKAD